VGEKKQDPDDVARAVAANMRNIHACFEKADEVYRRFRACLFADPPLPQYIPRDWIPISKH
jgi:DNA-binding transcriptional regulator PaaX